MDYVQKYITSLKNVSFDEHVVEGAIAYFAGETLFAIYVKNKLPKRLSLRGDAQLVKQLRERYESIVLPDNLDRKTWNQFLLTKQFDEDFITSMILHSYITSGGDYLGDDI